MAVYVVRNEQDAFALLKKAVDRQLPEDAQLAFEGGLSLTIHLTGPRFKGSVNPRVMRSLLAVQQGIYRSYASAKYGNARKRLSEEEKTALEINVKVRSGTTGLEVPSEDIAKHLISELATKMTPEQLFICVLTIIVLYFGQSAFRSYLEHRRETRQKEVSDETQRETLGAMKFISEQETKRMEILSQAIKRVPAMRYVPEQAAEAHEEVLRGIASAQKVDVAGIEMPQDATLTLVQNARRSADEVRLDGLYRLEKLDWSEPSRFKVRVRDVKSGLILDAEVQDDTFTGRYKDLLKEAEWSRVPVKLSINARRVSDDEYRGAVIIHVEAAPKKAA